MGGIFIAFGGALAVSVGPNCPGIAQSNPGLLKMITGALTCCSHGSQTEARILFTILLLNSTHWSIHSHPLAFLT